MRPLPGAGQPALVLVDTADHEGDPPAHQVHQPQVGVVAVGLRGIDHASLAASLDAHIQVLDQHQDHVAHPFLGPGQPLYSAPADRLICHQLL